MTDFISKSSQILFPFLEHSSFYFFLIRGKTHIFISYLFLLLQWQDTYENKHEDSVNNYLGSVSGQMNLSHATLDSIIKKANNTDKNFGTSMDMINKF